MNVLLASRRPAYPFFQGGAERSLYELGRALAARGHRVIMIGECGPLLQELEPFFVGSEIVEMRWETETATVRGETVTRRQILICQLPGPFEVIHTFTPDFRTIVEDVVRNFEPDAICTQLEGALEVAEFVGATGAHVLHFIRDTAFSFNFHPLIKVPGSTPPPVCIANSRFTADFVAAELGRRARVLYPIVRLPVSAPSSPLKRRSLLFVNPLPSKGGEVLHRTAVELPDVSFRVLPGWAFEVSGQWRQLPNVEAWDWPVLDMASAYRSVDLVVLPSQSSEGFGRVAIEAQLAGTPVLASCHSGLSEILGDSAPLVEDFQNPVAWRDAIRSVINAPEELGHWRQVGLQNAQRFAPDVIARRFERLIDELDAIRSRKRLGPVGG